MEETAKLFTELGTLVGIVVSGGLVGVLSLRWLGNNIIKPGAEAFVAYLNTQTDSTKKNVESYEALVNIEKDIRDAINEMVRSHSDPHSTFSTVQTNHSIRLLAEAVARIANGIDPPVDVTELMTEIKITLAKGRVVS